MNSTESEDRNRDSYKKALLAIEYRPEAKSALNSLSNTPKIFQLEFMKLLEENPQGPIDEYLAEVREKYNSWLNPYENNDANLALHQARKIGKYAEKEFIRVVDVLGDSINLKDLICKLEKKYGDPYKSDNSNKDQRAAVEVLLRKYNMDVEHLMRHLKIEYINGGYLHNGKRYEEFCESAIAADKDITHGDESCHTDISELFANEKNNDNSNAVNDNHKRELSDKPRLTNNNYTAEPIGGGSKWNVYKNDTGEIVAVKEGFNWWAFFFGGLWAFVKGLTWAGIIGISIAIVANRMPTDADIIAFPIILTLMLVYGFMGNSWVASKLEKQKYLLVKKVDAGSAEGAKAKLNEVVSTSQTNGA